MIKNAVLLCGGNGSRLAPLTNAINKSLINVGGKAVVDYPLNSLKKMGIENVSIVLGGNHFEQVVSYLEGGERYGMSFNYVFQGKPEGISQAINLCERYVGDDKFVVLLGDNLFSKSIKWKDQLGAQVVLDGSQDLERFGVATIENNKIVKIEEKPKHIDQTKQNYAISGCYLFDNKFFEFFKETKKGQRDEFEIVDIISKYQAIDKLDYVINAGIWYDAGTHESISKINRFFYGSK